MVTKILARILAIFVIVGLAACSPGTPKQIAAYPRNNTGTSGQPPLAIVHDAYLALAVADASQVADQATRMAEDYGGYASDRYTSPFEGWTQVTLSLSVPAASFDGLHRGLLGLGTLIREDVTGALDESSRVDSWGKYSHLTLELRQQPQWQPPDLNPRLDWAWKPASPLGQTFQAALGVTLAIFSYLAQAGIWIVVVGGPFALLGWLGWKLFKKLKRTS